MTACPGGCLVGSRRRLREEPLTCGNILRIFLDFTGFFPESEK